MMTRLTIPCLATVTAFLAAACGCPTLEPININDRRVREATVTRFDPTWDIQGNRPTPEYSIHNFLFPNDISSSGTLPNDLRMAGGKSALLSSQQFTALDPGSSTGDSAVFTVEYYTRNPSNSGIVGDLVVIDITTTTIPPTARIRVMGSLALFADALPSGSATDFVQYIEAHEGEFPIVAGQATPGGRNLATGSTASSIDSIRVVDARGADVTGLVAVPPGITSTVDATFMAFEVDVRPGEVYYYRARNGVEFAVLIEDVFRASLPPNLRRMTIKFAELRSLLECTN